MQTRIQSLLDDVQSKQSELVSENSELRKKLRSSEAEVKRLNEQLKFANKNRFGDKRQKPRKESSGQDVCDRNAEKEKFDGTPNTGDELKSARFKGH